MSQQFVVPQFIDVEDKILGPINVRQFITLLVGVGIIVGLYQLLYKLGNSAPAFFVSAFGVLILLIAFSFVRINGRPFHLFLLNFLESFRNPSMRLWNNMAAERIQYRREPPPPAPPPTKQPVTQTNLARLSMLVDTGGAFHEEEDALYWGQTLPKTMKQVETPTNEPTE